MSICKLSTTTRFSILLLTYLSDSSQAFVASSFCRRSCTRITRFGSRHQPLQSTSEDASSIKSTPSTNNVSFLGPFAQLPESFDTDHAAAHASLERLRDRQKSELLETERMLDALTMTRYDDSHAHAASHHFSTAASILSGTDYGFVSRSEGPPATLQGGLATLSSRNGVGVNYGPPSNLLTLGTQQFMRNLRAMKGEYSDDEWNERPLTLRQAELHAKLQQLTLNSTAIWEREYKDGPIVAPWIIKVPYLAICNLLDVVFEHSYVPSRFFLLETVARMPYFSYISMLHLYETLGFWRRSADAKRIHFAEEINEYAHLIIMESLGGDQSWWVRFVAQHSAIVYFVALCSLFAMSPSLSYRFSELLESHAVNTYSVFLEDNEELLKELPPVDAAVNYYSLGMSDPFYAEFQIASVIGGNEVRRPGQQMQNMYDVFSAICADEGDHVRAMEACLDPEVSLRSPSVERRVVAGLAALALASYVMTTTGIVDPSLLDTGSLDAAATAVSGDMTMAELLTAGVAGLVQQLRQAEDAQGMSGFTEELIEGGVVLTALERFSEKLVELLSRFL